MLCDGVSRCDHASYRGRRYRHGQPGRRRRVPCWQEDPAAGGEALRCSRKSILDPVPTIGAIHKLQFRKNANTERVPFSFDRLGEPREWCRISDAIVSSCEGFNSFEVSGSNVQWLKTAAYLIEDITYIERTGRESSRAVLAAVVDYVFLFYLGSCYASFLWANGPAVSPSCFDHNTVFTVLGILAPSRYRM